MARLLAGVLVLAAVLPSVAFAHQLKLFATLTGDRIEGRVYFMGGDPAAVAIEVMPAGAKAPLTTHSGKDGRFSIQVPSAESYQLVANVGDGHVAKTSIGGATRVEPSSGPSAAAPSADIELLVAAAVAREVTPLREELAAYAEQVRLRDVLGGLGYVVGLAGFAAWLKSSRKR